MLQLIIMDLPRLTVPIEKLRSKYYKKRGYDHNGIPTPKTLKRLGIQTPTGLQIPS
jgi:aldehyde:ferredoxin oxidoreductase